MPLKCHSNDITIVLVRLASSIAFLDRKSVKPCKVQHLKYGVIYFLLTTLHMLSLVPIYLTVSSLKFHRLHFSYYKPCYAFKYTLFKCIVAEISRFGTKVNEHFFCSAQFRLYDLNPLMPGVILVCIFPGFSRIRTEYGEILILRRDC